MSLLNLITLIQNKVVEEMAQLAEAWPDIALEAMVEGLYICFKNDKKPLKGFYLVSVVWIQCKTEEKRRLVPELLQ